MKKAKPTKRAQKPATKASKARSKAQPGAGQVCVVARSVSTPFAYLELSIQERVNETSLPRMFELVKKEILSNRPTKVLVDMREASVDLTISDKLGLVKMVIAAFVGIVDCFAIVLRPVDILPEKFFEPAVTSRGLPAYATTEIEDAIYWLGQKRKPAR